MSNTAMSNSKHAATVVCPVILCGGSGTRLWPLSRSGFPKQFLVLSGNEHSQSLFQEAIVRLQNLGQDVDQHIAIGQTLVVTNEEHRFLALDQLRELQNNLSSQSTALEVTLLLEPIGRNTAPALTLAALQAEDGRSDVQLDPIMVITPADQTVQDSATFTKALQECIATVNSDISKNTIAILGITPTSAQTGYGYILRVGPPGAHGDYAVKAFVEKPDSKTAQQYLDNGNYLWNSGMFVMRASTWLQALKAFRPDIFGATETAWQGKSIDSSSNATFVRPDKALFKTIPSESIDYAVIEKCPGSQFTVRMVELDAGWNDLGAWDAVWQVGKQDTEGNVVSGDTVLANTKNSLVHATSRLVTTSGVKNLVIVETADAVLIADRANSQDVKEIVSQLEKSGREEKNLHRKVARPWGWYDSVDEGERFKVKRIQVKPGASLSLQMHHHRAEHWIVVKGIAQITNGEKVITLKENESTFIPQGQKHRLANPGTEPLEIIEVQSGAYLEEDDIVRFEDTYGRS
jgi:mannose-1-phosphate guanylyltransferase/mannose-6-phosphate isomerase